MFRTPFKCLHDLYTPLSFFSKVRFFRKYDTKRGHLLALNACLTYHCHVGFIRAYKAQTCVTVTPTRFEDIYLGQNCLVSCMEYLEARRSDTAMVRT